MSSNNENKAEKEISIKILFWGPHLAGKTTILETLHQIAKKADKEVIPLSEITKIEQRSGATLYFDKLIFSDTQSIAQEKFVYNVFTVAGAKRFKTLRRKVYRGTDGVIFVFDSRRSRLNENIESLKELVKVSKGNLIKNIPLVVMLNKQDIPDPLNISEATQILKEQSLMFEPEEELFVWNPIIFETIGTYDKEKNIYQAFKECITRTKLYLEEKKLTKTARINLVLPEEDKKEWEQFAKERLNVSLSQMIRDAVREYQTKYQTNKPIPRTSDLNLEQQIEKIVRKKMDELVNKLKLLNSSEN